MSANRRNQAEWIDDPNQLRKRSGTAGRDADGHRVPGEFNHSTGLPMGANDPSKRSSLTPEDEWRKTFGPRKTAADVDIGPRVAVRNDQLSPGKGATAEQVAGYAQAAPGEAMSFQTPWGTVARSAAPLSPQQKQFAADQDWKQLAAGDRAYATDVVAKQKAAEATARPGDLKAAEATAMPSAPTAAAAPQAAEDPIKKFAQTPMGRTAASIVRPGAAPVLAINNARKAAWGTVKPAIDATAGALGNAVMAPYRAVQNQGGPLALWEKYFGRPRKPAVAINRPEYQTAQ